MATGSGTDAVAQQANPTASVSANPGATDAPTQIFNRAVVVEVLYDLIDINHNYHNELCQGDKCHFFLFGSNHLGNHLYIDPPSR